MRWGFPKNPLAGFRERRGRNSRKGGVEGRGGVRKRGRREEVGEGENPTKFGNNNCGNNRTPHKIGQTSRVHVEAFTIMYIATQKKTVEQAGPTSGDIINKLQNCK